MTSPPCGTSTRNPEEAWLLPSLLRGQGGRVLGDSGPQSKVSRSPALPPCAPPDRCWLPAVGPSSQLERTNVRQCGCPSADHGLKSRGKKKTR